MSSRPSTTKPSDTTPTDTASTETRSRRHGSHAGPRSRSGEPEVPQPSHAERARTLVHRTTTGSLSTLSRHQPGFPFGSVMPFALDTEGRALMLISKMAMHTQNLDHDPRASLLVPEAETANSPLGAGRVTLVGRGLPVPEAERGAVRELYLERHDNARYWVDYADFGFYRLETEAVYFVGGFGVMGWVEVEDYARASPDPLADAGPGIIAHMNQDHADALVLFARVYGGVETTEAAMTAVDRLGFHLKAKTEDRYHGLRIAFPRPIDDPRDSRGVMVEMVREARRRAENTAE